MAAGDRYKNGKPKDIVRHFDGYNGYSFCGRKNVGYITNDWLDVTCLNCIISKITSDNISRSVGNHIDKAQAFHNPKVKP